MTTTQLTTASPVIVGVATMDAAEARPRALSGEMQSIAQSYLDARKRAGYAWLDMGRCLSEARAEAKHGEWRIFLDATNTSEDWAKRLIAIYQQSLHDRVFADAIRTNFLSVATGYELISASPEVHDRLLNGDAPPTVKQIRDEKRQAAKSAPAPTLDQGATAPDLPPEFAIVQRRLATHGIELTSHIQGQHRAFVTKKPGLTGIVTFDWQYVLDRLSLLEDGMEDAPEPPPAAPAPRPPSATVATYDAQERADQEILTEAIGMLAGARGMLSQVKVAQRACAALDADIAREQARAFWLYQSERLPRFSSTAMISLVSWKQALDHIGSLVATEASE